MKPVIQLVLFIFLFLLLSCGKKEDVTPSDPVITPTASGDFYGTYHKNEEFHDEQPDIAILADSNIIRITGEFSFLPNGETKVCYHTIVLEVPLDTAPGTYTVTEAGDVRAIYSRDYRDYNIVVVTKYYNAGSITITDNDTTGKTISGSFELPNDWTGSFDLSY